MNEEAMAVSSRPGCGGQGVRFPPVLGAEGRVCGFLPSGGPGSKSERSPPAGRGKPPEQRQDCGTENTQGHAPGRGKPPESQCQEAHPGTNKSPTGTKKGASRMADPSLIPLWSLQGMILRPSDYESDALTN